MKLTLPTNIKPLFFVIFLLNSFIGFTQEIPKIKIDSVKSNNFRFSLKGTFWDTMGLICNFGYPHPPIIIEEAYSNIRLDQKSFNQGNIYHPYQLLRGRVPGLTISKPGGDPLGTYDVYQRGQHSILGSTEPLVVINGLPGASLYSIDVQDIESINILRDASQTSFYGARGANGVIEIQSKKIGYNRKLNVSYSGYASVENVIKTPEVLNADQYRTVVTNPNSSFYNPASNFGASTDWAEAITRTGVSQAHNLAFGGGIKNTAYRLSLNYRDVNGVVPHSGFNQANALLYLSQDLFKNKVRITGNAGITQRNFTDINKDIFYYAAIFNPTAPIRTDTGYFQQTLFDYQNPVALSEQIDNQGEQTIYTTNLAGRWDILNNVRAEVQYGFQQQDYTRHYKVNKDTYPTLFNYQSELNLSNQSLQTSLSYNGYFDKHELQLNGGYQYQEWTNEFYNTTGYDLATNGLYFTNVNFNAQPDSLAIAYKTNTKLAALFGRLQYDYNNWLFVNAHWRREGSTRFGDNNKWGNFYGFGAGVDFAELMQLSDIDQFKLRLSYGVAGNLPADGVYADRILGQGVPFLYNGQFIPGVIPTTNENQNLKWEERSEWNIGFDASLFSNRLFASLDIYRGRTKDIIYGFFVDVPPNLAPFTYANNIDFENRGVELMLNARLVDRAGFYWEFGTNFAADRSRFASAVTPKGVDIQQIVPPAYLGVPGSCCVQPVVLKKGELLGRFYGLEFLRFEGDRMIFKDINGNGASLPDDGSVIGNALPDFTFGIMNKFRWNRLEINVFLRGVIGHDIMNMHRSTFGFPGFITQYNVLQTAVEGEVSRVPYSQGLSSYNVEDASFATLENLVIGYNFKPKQRYLSSLKMYVAAQNLFTLSGYSGNDPEVRFKNRAGNFQNANSLVPGLDVRVGYYATRTFTLGVQAEF